MFGYDFIHPLRSSSAKVLFLKVHVQPPSRKKERKKSLHRTTAPTQIRAETRPITNAANRIIIHKHKVARKPTAPHHNTTPATNPSTPTSPVADHAPTATALAPAPLSVCSAGAALALLEPVESPVVEADEDRDGRLADVVSVTVPADVAPAVPVGFEACAVASEASACVSRAGSGCPAPATAS